MFFAYHLLEALVGRMTLTSLAWSGHPSASRVNRALDSCHHRIQRQPDVPYLAVALGGFSFGEHPVGQGSRVRQERYLSVMELVRDELGGLLRG